MIIKIIIATIVIVLTYFIITKNKEHLKNKKINENHRPDNSWANYKQACETNCKNNNTDKNDIAKCIQNRCVKITSVDNPSQDLVTPNDKINRKTFIAIIQNNEPWVIPEHIINKTFNILDSENTGFVNKKWVDSYKDVLNKIEFKFTEFDNFIILNKEFNHFNKNDKINTFTLLNEKLNNFIDYKGLLNNINILRNYKPSKEHQIEFDDLDVIDKKQAEFQKNIIKTNQANINKILEAKQNIPKPKNKFYLPFQSKIQKSLPTIPEPKNIDYDKLKLEIGKRLINDGILKDIVNQNCGHYCKNEKIKQKDFILKNIKVDKDTIYNIYNPDSQVNMKIDNDLISGRSYQNNKNFWENVPRKVIDKVCDPRGSDNCIVYKHDE